MQDETLELIVEGQEDAMKAIGDNVSSSEGGRVHVSERLNFDGSEAIWIAYVTLLVKALPSVFTFISDMVDGRRVTKIKCGDLEIHNPSREDVEVVRTACLKG